MTATWSVEREDMKTSRRKGRSLNMEGELSPEEDRSYVKPAWWEIAVFRFLNAIMVIFFLTAVVKLQSDDNACLWVPTFLVPAFLSTIVAVKPQLSGCKTGSPPKCKLKCDIQYKCDY